jgi:hypothetical protein
MKSEFLPFTNEMIPDAGRLLAQRHACNRERLPMLPERFDRVEIATKADERLCSEKYKVGYDAFREGMINANLI